MKGLAIAAALGCTVVVSTHAQTPARDVRQAAPAPSGTASISGVVVSAEAGGRPVRLAYVVIGALTGTLRVTSTDGEGRFTVTGLPADRYVIGASKPPFLGAMAGARRPARPGTAIVVGDGQKVADVAIRLPLGAVIAGTIVDDRGEPAANVSLALQQWRMQNGERALVATPGATANTDERGRYRIFGLPPGEYIVEAGRGGFAPSVRALTDAVVEEALRTGRMAANAAPAPNVRYAPVYFPGTPRSSDATPIALAAGEERQGVDFRLELARTARVEGVLAASDGQALPPRAMVTMMATSSSSVIQTGFGAVVQADGRFAFSNVPPGTYTVLSRVPGPQAAATALFATAQVEVAGVDQSGVQLTLRPALSFSARVAFDGTTPVPALAGRRIPLRSLTPMPVIAAPQVAVTTATGTFDVTNVSPGRYVIGGPLFLGATSQSLTWALQSVVVDGRDVTDLPLEITADALPKEVVVTYGDRSQGLSGTLSTSSGEPATEYTIVVFPADRAYWIPASRRILTTRPGTDGRFQLSGQGPNTLPPGRYLLAAVTDIDRDEQFDPAFLAALVPSAVPVTLAAGEQKAQDLVIR